jgi:hypothetical protein
LKTDGQPAETEERSGHAATDGAVTPFASIDRTRG